MKKALSPTAVGLVAALLVGIVESRADDKTQAPKESTTSEKANSGAVDSITSQAKPSTNAAPSTASGLMPAGSAMLDLASREVAGTTTSTVRQVTHEATIKEPRIRSLDERGGALRYIAREPKPSNLLQLINPFAPISMGEGGQFVNQWRPSDGSKPVPRGFRDEGTHEPMSVLLGWP